MPDEPEDASPGAGGYWSEAFQRLVGHPAAARDDAAELAPGPGTGGR